MNSYSTSDTYEAADSPECDILSVLLPTDLKPDGYFYGWAKPLICVAGVIQAGTFAEASQLLAETSRSHEWINVQRDIAVDFPSVLGRCSTPNASSQAAEGFHGGLEPYFEAWDEATGFTQFRAGLVYYKRPNRSLMQFYSSDSRELDILPSQTAASSAIRRPLPASLGLTLDFTRPSMASSARLDSAAICHVNASHTVATFVEQALYKPRSTHTSKPTPAESEELISMQGARQTKFTSRAMKYFMYFLRDFSTTVEQLDVRSEQVSFIVTQAPFIFGRVKTRSTDSISRYVKFYNCIWLTLNDMIIGVAFGSFLCENCHVLGSMLDSFTQFYLVDWMQRALIWLNSWPAGLKLNTELSQFYCHSLLIAITIWGRVLRSMGPYYPALLWVVGAMGCCGMTMIVSLLSDIIGVLTSHLYVCYVLSATAFRHQLGLAGSLWNLFRGKRFNVLRNRLDSWDYDIDQLLLGTILFTLVAFLYPTVLTYYALFATTHLAIIMLHGLLDTISALLNHFPLFALMLRIKDPMRLPGHIVFKRLSSGSLILENQPASLSSVFAHYGQLWSRLSSHYHPLRLLGLLMSGRLLTLISRSAIRFSMVPSRTAEDDSSTNVGVKT